MEKRQAYLDRLKVFMTVLVVLHHTAITYGGAGSWYYSEPSTDVATALLSTFTAVNQSFFMGLFFFISGYVTPSSYDRYGAVKFMKARLIRFGIPIIVFMAVITPLLGYVSTGYEGSFASYLKTVVMPNLHLGFAEFEVGPLWYLVALLLFFAAYAGFRLIVGNQSGKKAFKLTSGTIAGYIVVVAAANFFIRLAFPVGETVLSLQLAYFPAYVGLFIGGIAAYRGKWLDQLTEAAARKWRVVVCILIISFPIVMLLGGAMEGDTSFEGGMNWQSAIYSITDPILGLGISYMLLVAFRKRWNGDPSPVSRWLSAQAFLVYIIHALIVTYVSYWLRGVSIDPLLKFILVGCLALPLCFLLASLIRRIPGGKREAKEGLNRKMAKYS